VVLIEIPSNTVHFTPVRIARTSAIPDSGKAELVGFVKFSAAHGEQLVEEEV
jgi:hypothetical protein